MGRIHQPTAALDAKGSFLNHPERERARESELKPTGALPRTAPSDFSPEEKDTWRKFLKMLPAGVATEWDWMLARTLVRLMAKEIHGTLVGEVRVPITVQERAQMITLAAKFGMSPSDRAKIAVEAPAENKLAKFLTKKSSVQ